MLAHAECQASVWVLLLHTAPTAWPTHSAHVHVLRGPGSSLPPVQQLPYGCLVHADRVGSSLTAELDCLPVGVGCGLSTSSRQWGTVLLGK